MVSPLFECVCTEEANNACIEVRAGKVAHTVPGSIYGNFLEHLGFAIYGGLWAQILSNPVFEWNHNLSEGDLEKLETDGHILCRFFTDGRLPDDVSPYWQPGVHATGFGVAVLDNAIERGMPLPWVDEVDGAGRVFRTAGRLGFGIRLHPAGGMAGIRQGVFLPVHRTGRFEGKVIAYNEGSGERSKLQVGIRRRLGSGEVLAATEVLISSKWTRVEFELGLNAEDIGEFEPVDFFLRCAGETDVILDRAELWPADHVLGFDPEVVARAKDWGVPVLRWPGGNFVSGYHWRDGVGDLDLRPTRPNQAWGGLEYNFFGTDEFMRFCELIGAEPHICVNLGTGTEEEAASWVEYCNGSPDTPMGSLRAANGHSEPYQVRWWEVGNEIYGVWQIGNIGSDENARRYKAFARAMKEVDEEIILIANGNHFDFLKPGPQWSFASADGKWHQELVEQAGDHLQLVSLHALPQNRRGIQNYSTEEAILALLAHPVRWERRDIPHLLTQMNPAGDRRVKVAVTEWGILGPDASRPRVENFGEVAYAGLFLNFLIRNAADVPLANATALLHGGCIRKAGARVYVDPQYHAIKLYSQASGSKAVRCRYTGPGYDTPGPETARDVRDVPVVDCAALLSDDGLELTVFLVNRSVAKEMQVKLIFKDFHHTGRASCFALASEDPVAVAQPFTEDPFEPEISDISLGADSTDLLLPPLSLVCLVVKGA